MIREHYGRDVYRTEIRENVRLAECVSFGKTVFDYAPDSHGAEDYAALAREVSRREGGQA
jgi:chromosome partitioning protein